MAHTSHVVAKIKELLEAVFSVRSVSRLYKGSSFPSHAYLLVRDDIAQGLYGKGLFAKKLWS
jgi:hypothetical protein